MFKLIKIENGRMNVPEPEYHIAGTTELKAGQAVALSSGKLVKNATAPTHITLASAKANEAKVPCVRIEPSQVYEVSLSAAPASGIAVGDKITIEGTYATEVIATKTDGGILTIVSLDNATNKGDKITVRF